MATPCNPSSVSPVKVSQLVRYKTIDADDFFLSIESGSALYSRRSTFGDVVHSLANITGSYTGSFKGYVSASLPYNKNKKVAFYGTASWAQNALYSSGNTTGTGTTDYFTYWSGTNTLASTNYLVRNSTAINKGGMPTGRVSVNNPLQFSSLGEQLIQFSASGESIYGLGLQTSNNYLRTTSNFSIYYSGSHVDTDNLPGKDVNWNAGKSGFGVLGVKQRLLSVGHIIDSTNVNAQLHVHLSGSVGWPTGYNQNTNVILVTSGSNLTKLMKLSGSGQLDIAGDVVALSTFSTSDIKLKKDIKPILNGLEKTSLLNPVEFYWIDSNKHDYGVIAQEIEKDYPELVTVSMDGHKVVKYNSLIPILISAINELKSQLEVLKSKIK